MIPKIIKLIASISLFGYGVYQITETFIGNGIFLIILSILLVVLYFKNEGCKIRARWRYSHASRTRRTRAISTVWRSRGPISWIDAACTGAREQARRSAPPASPLSLAGGTRSSRAVI